MEPQVVLVEVTSRATGRSAIMTEEGYAELTAEELSGTSTRLFVRCPCCNSRIYIAGSFTELVASRQGYRLACMAGGTQ